MRSRRHGGAKAKTPPESMKISLRQRLNSHAKTRWPELTRVEVRHRAGFAYIDGVLPDGEVLPLCRLRFTGALHTRGGVALVAAVRLL